MTAKPKQIVIDKNALITFMGRGFGELCRFSRQHVLLLSDTLLYECATATRQSPAVLLGKCERLIQENARYCSMSTRFVQWEAWHCIPYPEALMDARLTGRIRHGDALIRVILASDIPDHLHSLHMRNADALFVEGSAYLKSEVDSRVEDIGTQVKRLPNRRPERLVEWLGRQKLPNR